MWEKNGQKGSSQSLTETIGDLGQGAQGRRQRRELQRGSHGLEQRGTRWARGGEATKHALCASRKCKATKNSRNPTCSNGEKMRDER